jgi:hypothetical protein
MGRPQWGLPRLRTAAGIVARLAIPPDDTPSTFTHARTITAKVCNIEQTPLEFQPQVPIRKPATVNLKYRAEGHATRISFSIQSEISAAPDGKYS